MFQLSKEDLQSKILGCGDISSIDPVYQFTKDENTNKNR